MLKIFKIPRYLIMMLPILLICGSQIISSRLRTEGILPEIGYLLTTWGETVKTGGGLGYDGPDYAIVVEGLPYILIDDSVSFPRKGLFVSPLLAWSIIKVFGLTFDAKDIVFSFQIVNLISILFSVYIFDKICLFLNIDNKITWIGWAGLFLSFPILKFSMYNSILVDYVALFLSILMFYFYLKKKNIGILITALFGFFTLHTFVFYALFLMLFPYRYSVEKSYSNIFSNVISVLPVLGYFIAYAYFIELGGLGRSGDPYPYPKLLTPLLPLSLICCFLYLYFACLPFTCSRFINQPKDWFSGINYLGLLQFMVIFILLKTISINVLNVNGESAIRMLHYFTYRPVAYPFVSLISHFVWFGPWIIIALLNWKKIVSEASNYGSGLLLSLLFIVLYSINSESRHLIAFMPILLFLCLKVLNELRVNLRTTLFFIFLSLVFSRFWLQIHSVKESADLYSGHFAFSFPAQIYFMNFGPWMSFQMWCIFSIIAVVAWIILKKDFKVNDLK